MSHSQICSLGVCLLLFVVGPAAAANTSDEQVLKDYQISTEGSGLLEFFRQRTSPGDEDARFKTLIKQLGDDDFDVRETASQQLMLAGRRAKTVLQQAANDPDVEVKRRAEDCLRQIEQGTASVVLATAVRVLAQKKPAGAVGVLFDYLPVAEDEHVAEEIRQMLPALAVRDGKVDPVLIAGLADKQPLRRAAAAAALARAGDAPSRAAIRKLLADPVPSVRFQVGMALASAREKEAIPVLIDLLTENVTLPEMGMIEDLLYRLAAEKAPKESAGTDAETKRKYRDAWAAWWKEQGPKIDLAKLSEATKLLNYTTVVLLDMGQVVDLDNNNKARFTIGNLEFPLDVQYLPGDRILVAEHNASRVTERNRENKILWTKPVDSPLVAQRLPNGNTFIASRTQLLEVDKEGKEVFTHTRPGGEAIMRAQKLRNGEYALVVQLGVTRFIRINAEGKELASFGVDVRTSGGRIEVLPNGHVLIPENGNNRVVEHDAQGKIVWEVSVESPIAAVRLPNGHTLVTSMNPQRGAVELDKAGKEVWNFKAQTRVTRAYRR